MQASLIQSSWGTAPDGPLMLATISAGAEGFLIGSWVILGGGLVWSLRRLKVPLLLIGSGLGSAALLSGVALAGHYLLFRKGWWLPAGPSVAGIWLGALLGLVYLS